MSGYENSLSSFTGPIFNSIGMFFSVFFLPGVYLLTYCGQVIISPEVVVDTRNILVIMCGDRS